MPIITRKEVGTPEYERKLQEWKESLSEKEKREGPSILSGLLFEYETFHDAEEEE